MIRNSFVQLSAGLPLMVLALAPASVTAATAERTFESMVAASGQLDIRTSDGRYVIKPYSAAILETTFIPAGEGYDPASHAVVLAPAAVMATAQDKGDRIEYATAGIAATITKSPFRISYTYKGKPLVAEKRGFLKVRDDVATGSKDINKGEARELDAIEFALDANEALYGAGARAVGMNRRGNRFTLYNKADYGYGATSKQLNYGMPIAMSSKLYALHFDNAQTGYLDFDSKKDNTLTWETIGGRKTYQVIAGDTWQDVVGNYTSLTGKQPLPPRWAFGNFAMRFGYHTEAEARKTVHQFALDDIPLDAIVMDLYWFGKDVKGTMGNLAWDKDNFPNPTGMIADFQKQGVQTVVISEPFIVNTSSRWQEAVDKKILGTGPDGKPLSYDFFFGHTGLIDIFGAPGRDWLWDIYKGLRQQGIKGVWGDLGEPELHPTAMRHATGSADEVHNIYGHQWARLVAEGYQKDFPTERPFILMRAGYSGTQRYGIIPWSGDVDRSWGGLQSQPEIALQMGMQGAGYMHSDLGGFANPVEDDELYARWLQYGVFQPVFRPHAQEEVPSEPVYRNAATKALARQAIRLRYALLPYNYTLGFENNQRGLPLMRPMVYEEPGNPKAQSMSSTYLWGKDFLVTPVMTKGAQAADVYFPATSAWFDFYTGERHAGGASKTVALKADHIPVYVRAGAFIPMTAVVQTTRDYNTRRIALHYYHDAAVTAGSGQLYDDDGATAQAYEHGKYELLRFASVFKGRTLSLSVASELGKQQARQPRAFDVSVHNVANRPAAVKVDGKAAAFGWDAQARLLTVTLPANAAAARSVVVTL
ncbi:alpha-glucosidase/oligosaccharide 4-alpha-D-glucosyltransferase [Duganella sp. 3397]|uniref:TIM-barrel domain-containing protein n=1 Tax=Duganella sp. 3397 TaxID=2817732 RepID=UPI002855A3AA|nr:TIM-barrel domain-containing protein [Duganella sp. 3397]MDR7051726.1 alpha-glucosidase/oligosaccharide 4-alpha-D-glucosyltransferase [Duganella sp. 3397]